MFPSTRKIPGLNTFSDISLKRGMTDDAELWEWRLRAQTGDVERKNGSIVLLDDHGDEKARWNFREAWPTKWTGPSLSSTGNEVAVAAVVFAVMSG